MALFPGSFKPPHAAHLFAIIHLLQRPDVGIVVIIISNRCRIIPGTTQAIDAHSARELMLKMFRYLGLPASKLRVEIAPHRAVSHALEYFHANDTSRKLLFCIGAADLSSGDDRYKEIGELSRKTGISAELIPLPTEAKSIRATNMRRALSGGMECRDVYFDGLPDALADVEKMALWVQNRRALQPIEQIARGKLRQALADLGMASAAGIQIIDAATVDPVFRLLRPDAADCIVKYAGETVGEGSFDGLLSLKPARRLAVEKRALKHIKKRLKKPFKIPEVLQFDRVRRILVLTDSHAGMVSLRGQLRSGQVKPEAAALAGAFLGNLHRMELPEFPFWGSKAGDRSHWNSLLQELANTANSFLLREGFPDLCRDLIAQGKDYAGSHVLHLDFCADNLAFGPGTVFVANFERCSCFGDPAFDLATLAADYLCAATALPPGAGNRISIRAFLTGYQGILDEPNRFTLKRIFVYAAFLMLSRLKKDVRLTTPILRSERQKLAIRILCGIRESEAISHASGDDQGVLDFYDSLLGDIP